MAEDSGDPGFSSDELDSFSHDSREKQNASYIKPAFCTEENKDSLNDSYAFTCLPMSGCPYKVDQRPSRTSQKKKPHSHRTLRFVSEQEDPCYAWTSSNEMLNLLPSHQRRTRRRQNQEEEEAVIMIQSAWRGWKVRKEIDEMNRAATQIQAAFRGYMTRKKLPLGLCCGCQIDRPPSKKSARTTSRSLPGDPYYAWTSSNEMLNLLPSHQWKTRRRQHKKEEEEAVTTIKSAQRGWQSRKEIDKMNRAATQIQAAFRGYMTRKELPLGLCSGRQVDRPPSKKKSARTKSRSVPLLNRVDQLDLATVATENQSMILPNNRLNIGPKHLREDFSLLDPNISFFQVKSAIRPNREVFTYTSLNVLASRVSKQKYQDAATTIQAAWRKYQIRQKVRPMIQAVKSLKDFPSNFIINQTSWKRECAGHTVEQHEIQQIIAKSTLRKVPQIRNINIYAMVKGMPASSQRPDISIKVQSTKAVIQGFQRDMSRGAQALYTVKSRNASRPSQILIRVDLQKGKDLPTKIEEMQKPGGC